MTDDDLTYPPYDPECPNCCASSRLSFSNMAEQVPGEYRRVCWQHHEKLLSERKMGQRRWHMNTLEYNAELLKEARLTDGKS